MSGRVRWAVGNHVLFLCSTSASGVGEGVCFLLLQPSCSVFCMAQFALYVRGVNLDHGDPMQTSHANNYAIAQRKRARARRRLVPCDECGCRFIETIGEPLTARCTGCGRIYHVRDDVQLTLGRTTPAPVRVYFDPTVMRTS